MVKFVSARGGRGGGRGRGRGGAVSAGADARQTLLQKKRAKMTDARDALVSLARTGGDARKKLDRIRNLKQGKLDVKKRGAITFTTTTKGQLLLTTKKREMAASGAAARRGGASGAREIQRGNLTRRVGRGGTLSITTKKTPSALKERPAAPSTAAPLRRGQPSHAAAKTPAARRPALSVARGGKRTADPIRPLTRTIKGELSAAAKLDQELLNTHVDPVLIKRTVRQSASRRHASPPGSRYVPQSPEPYFDRRRDRSRSPMDTDSYRYNSGRSRSSNRGYSDFDDPRRGDDDEAYRRNIRQSDDGHYDRPRTMADRLDGASGGSSYVSPLQGAKIQVTNLQESVSQDDITELFGDIGPLKRAKLIDQGVAEVVFVNRSDAQKAVEIYHNRQLDGRAMKCKLISSGGDASSSNFNYRLPPSKSQSRAPPPEMGAIHKALFNEKSGRGSSGRRDNDGRGSKPLFTVTVDKKGGSRY